MLKIGIVGYGYVGKAMHTVFNHNAEITIIDPAYSTTHITELSAIKPAVVFICLPAPTLDSGSVDISLISRVFKDLQQMEYTGLVVLKSTIPPHSASHLCKYQLRYIYSPEFLRQLHWESDAISPDIIILGGAIEDCNDLEIIYERHSHIRERTRFARTNHKDAALAKYAINTFLAAKVVFMNQLYELYSDMYGGAQVPSSNWTVFTHMIGLDDRIGQSHMNVPGENGLFGYGGACFPKDVKAMIGFDHENRLTVLREAELANTRIRLANK